MKKKVIAILLSAVTAISMIGCAGAAAPAAPAAEPAATEEAAPVEEAAPAVKVGIAAPDVTHGWVAGVAYYAEKYCKDNGLEYKVSTSADAAEMLKALNELFCLGVEYNELEEFASKLGADCAFFIRNKPVFAEGIGNVFSDVNISLKGIYMILIKPNIHVSTKEAYGGIIPHRGSMPLKEALRLSVNRWKGVVMNDFEESVFKRYPQIGQIKAWLYERGAVYAAMSGSGSSVFGLFNEEPKIEKINAGWFYKKMCL